MQKVVSYRNSTSNHNIWTFSIFGETVVSYRNSTSNHNLIGEHTTSPSLYLIEILHQTTTSRTNMSASTSCILSKFYIKPQRRPIKLRICRCCILSKFYIKPQLWLWVSNTCSVVSYRNSTSNHNASHSALLFKSLYLIEILHQTTTPMIYTEKSKGLYLIEILHQTTTYFNVTLLERLLYLIEILHQTTTLRDPTGNRRVVSYRNSTSNHNMPKWHPALLMLYLIEILHQTTTAFSRLAFASSLYLIEILHQTTTVQGPCGIRRSCILSKFYIKPQPSS